MSATTCGPQNRWTQRAPLRTTSCRSFHTRTVGLVGQAARDLFHFRRCMAVLRYARAAKAIRPVERNQLGEKQRDYRMGIDILSALTLPPGFDPEYVGHIGERTNNAREITGVLYIECGLCCLLEYGRTMFSGHWSLILLGC